MYEGVDMESARRDAFHWALYNTAKTMDVVRATEERYRVKYGLRGKRHFQALYYARNSRKVPIDSRL